MKSTFYYQRHYQAVAQRVEEKINLSNDILSEQTAGSTRAAGDAIESLVRQHFHLCLDGWSVEHSEEFSRRAMADLAFEDSEHFYTIVDIKTHRKDTSFNMPNLTSVERLARFYESDSNVFSLLIIPYEVVGTKIIPDNVIFTPIEFLSWQSLTIGALGWGQIQIKNSNDIQCLDGYSRKKWMLELCQALEEFYPREIEKIGARIKRFEEVKKLWQKRKDIWK